MNRWEVKIAVEERELVESSESSEIESKAFCESRCTWTSQYNLLLHI